MLPARSQRELTFYYRSGWRCPVIHYGFVGEAWQDAVTSAVEGEPGWWCAQLAGSAPNLELVPRAADKTGWDHPRDGANYKLIGLPEGKSVAVLQNGELVRVEPDMDGGTLIGEPHASRPEAEEIINHILLYLYLRGRFAIRQSDGVRLCPVAYNSASNKQEPVKEAKPQTRAKTRAPGGRWTDSARQAELTENVKKLGGTETFLQLLGSIMADSGAPLASLSRAAVAPMSGKHTVKAPTRVRTSSSLRRRKKVRASSASFSGTKAALERAQMVESATSPRMPLSRAPSTRIFHCMPPDKMVETATSPRMPLSRASSARILQCMPAERATEDTACLEPVEALAPSPPTSPGKVSSTHSSRMSRGSSSDQAAVDHIKTYEPVVCEAPSPPPSPGKMTQSSRISNISLIDQEISRDVRQSFVRFFENKPSVLRIGSNAGFSWEHPLTRQEKSEYLLLNMAAETDWQNETIEWQGGELLRLQELLDIHGVSYELDEIDEDLKEDTTDSESGRFENVD